MPITYSLVDGPAHSVSASGMLNQAWRPPALNYTPEYMRWQLSFPGPWPAPAVMAFRGPNPAGFAAATPRRVRLGNTHYEALIVSFVCVRPELQGQGVARGLYERLLAHIASLGCLVITYTTPGTPGDRVLRRAYADAGFEMRPIGEYALYARMAMPVTSSPWVVSESRDPEQLSRCIEQCANQDPSLIHGDPSGAQWEHYLRDPRPRRLLIAVNETESGAAAGWALRFEMRGPNGLDTVLTLDSAIVPRDQAGALPPLLDTVAELLRAGPSGPAVVAAPNLTGFPPASLRSAGLRQTASKFVGFVCAPKLPEPLQQAIGATLEVI